MSQPGPSTTAPWPTLDRPPRNVRDDLRDLEGLAASIAALGIIEPLSVIHSRTKPHLIDAGHRRKKAAVAAGRRLVPCMLRPDLAADADAVAGQARQAAQSLGERPRLNVYRR